MIDVLVEKEDVYLIRNCLYFFLTASYYFLKLKMLLDYLDLKK